MIQPRFRLVTIVWMVLLGLFGTVWFSGSYEALQSVLANGDLPSAWRVIQNAFSVPGSLFGLAVGAAAGLVVDQILHLLRPGLWSQPRR